MSEYFKTVFWQVEISVPKERAHEAEEFFLRSGAQSTFELLYAEGRPSNLATDDTELFFFFAEDFPARAFVPMALATLGLPQAAFTVSQVKYADYLKEFEKTFKAFALTARTALVPPWDQDNADVTGLKPLFLVPGMAFGTGKHATTQLMVAFLEETVRSDDAIIDMGTGSGILAIAALLYGAREAYGYDVETLAIESAISNLELNAAQHGTPLNAHFAVGDFSALQMLKTDAEHTVFIANILPNIFEANAASLRQALTHCRAWALSGIPDAQAESFAVFLRSIGITQFETKGKDEWQIFFSIAKST